MSSHRELPKQKACMSAQSVDSRLDTSDKYALRVQCAHYACCADCNMCARQISAPQKNTKLVTACCCEHLMFWQGLLQ